VRPAAVVVARGDAAGHVLIDRHEQLAAADVLVADANDHARANLLLDLHARLL
jgi:hypothetical protein